MVILRTRLTLILAFAAIYILWGSTFYAIRVAVEEVPPLFAAGVRFTIAGSVLYTWARVRGAVSLTRLQWRNAAILGVLMFLLTYSAIFWAEKSLPSGIVSVLIATLPLWTVIFESFVFRISKFGWTLAIPMTLGIAGVAVLVMGQSGGGSLNVVACIVVLLSEVAWASGSVLSSRLRLPASKPLSAGAQMLTGGLMLLLFSLAAGEMVPFPHVSMRAAYAIGYLIVAGSLVAFTAYVWLLGKMPATKVSSYAYVNPVVALALGHWLGGEALGLNTLFGAVLVLGSVVAILKIKSVKR